MSAQHVYDHAAGQRNQAGNRLSDRQDGPDAYPTKLECGLNVRKEHEETL